MDQDQYGFSPFVLTWVEKDEDDDDDHDRPKPSKPSKPVEKPALEKGDHFAYMVGYDDGTIRPNANITRAEVATIFFRLLTDDPREKYWSDQNPYSDISAGAWYNNAVSTMTRAGVLTGYDDGTFRPDQVVTREEAMQIILNYCEYKGIGPEGEWAVLVDYADADQIADYAMDAAMWNVIHGYLLEDENGNINPDETADRAEIAYAMDVLAGQLGK